MRDHRSDELKKCGAAIGDEWSGVIAASRRRPYVLLAEDEEPLRGLLASVMRDLGMDVEEVADGGRMLVRVAAHYRAGQGPEDIDLIVSDVRMPVCSGLDIFKGVRAAHWTTPVVLVTRHPTPEVYECARELGANVVLKPVNVAEFERVVLGLLSWHAPAARAC